MNLRKLEIEKEAETLVNDQFFISLEWIGHDSFICIFIKINITCQHT